MKILKMFLAFLLLCSTAGAAIDSTIVWEVRTTGAQTNGGGYKLGASGTDYSQQDAAQYALTGVTSAAADAIMLTASAAAVMVGNTCYVVSGTNATPGWYEIISVSVGVSITVDRNWGTGAVASGVVNVGGAFLFGGTLDDEFTEAVVAGNTVHVKSGSYTLGESISQASDGTAVAPIKWIGYTTTRDDVCVGDNRPFFTCAANTFTFGNYALFKNIRVTATNAAGFAVTSNCWLYNCKSTQTGAATRYAFSATSQTTWVSCEGISTNGRAFYMSVQCAAINCYAHDSVTCYHIASYGCRVVNSIADTATTGIAYGANYALLIVGNTIYNCTTGISGTTAYYSIFINNIISVCTTGASWTTATPINFWDFNCWNNTTDVTNVTKGPNAVTADPLLTDPANGDFTLQSGSPALNAGCQMNTNVGAVGAYKVNIGLDQDDNTAAGAGGATAYMGNF